MSKLSDEHFQNYLKLFEMQLYGVLEHMQEPAEEISTKFSEALLQLYSLNNEKLDSKISEQVKEIIDLLQNCITSMQFLDAKYQRIEHVADGLGDLAAMQVLNVCESNKSIWEKLDTDIQSNYKMLPERNIHAKFLELYQDAYIGSSNIVNKKQS